MQKKIRIVCLLLTITFSYFANISSAREAPSELFADNINLRSILTGDLNLISWQANKTQIRSSEQVKLVYMNLGYNLLWIKDNKLTLPGYELIQRVIDAKNDALLPEIYHSYVFSSLSLDSKIYNPELLDVIMTDAFVTLKSHLVNGIVNPKKQFKEWNVDREVIDYPLSIHNALGHGISNELYIKDTFYLSLRSEYIQLSNLENKGNLSQIKSNKLKLGDRGESVRLLRERLSLSDNNLFDRELELAIKDYQLKNNLRADGIVGKNTLDLLNKSLDERIETLAINMERYRWASTPRGISYIWVNIPAYNMAIIKDDNILFKSNVIVGNTKRQTPVFNDTLQYVVLNPYWNIPKTIYLEDKLPKLIQDPYSLGNSYQAISKATGEVVDPGEVDWYNESNLYRLRQLPSKYNALGRMKFLFPNSHDIYLHDTPERGLFKRGNRSISSGCVRVEHANELANYLLKEMNWDSSKVSRYTTGKNEKWIKLKDSLNYPVLLNYYTAWTNDGQHVIFSQDIYHKDEQLKKLYKEKLTSYL